MRESFQNCLKKKQTNPESLIALERAIFRKLKQRRKPWGVSVCKVSVWLPLDSWSFSALVRLSLSVRGEKLGPESVDPADGTKYLLCGRCGTVPSSGLLVQSLLE